MKKKKIFKAALQEMRESMQQRHKKCCGRQMRKLYQEADEVAEKAWEIISRCLEEEERQTVEKYIMKTDVIAQEESIYFYLQGFKDCVKFLKRLDIL